MLGYKAFLQYAVVHCKHTSKQQYSVCSCYQKRFACLVFAFCLQHTLVIMGSQYDDMQQYTLK